MFKKIMIALIVLILAAGAVSAIEIGDMTAPNGFKKGSGNFFEKDGYEISISSYSDSDKDILFQSDGDYQVSKDSGNIYKYTDKLLKHSGAVEIVEIDGKKYDIECFKKNADSDYGSAMNILNEFNKLNNLTPIEP